MSVFWQQPLAWWGLAALAIPILIHLLVREERRKLLFPTLRFLRSTRLVALRRRSVSDWPLLTIRLLLLTSAVAALAGPTWVSSARRDAWAQRIARAVVKVQVPVPSQVPVPVLKQVPVPVPVPVPGASAGASAGAPSADVDAVMAEERASSFTSEVFRVEGAVGDAVRDAVAWLDAQPPAAREIVFVGDMRQGALRLRDVEAIAPDVGIRFARAGMARPDPRVDLRAVADNGDGGTREYRLHVQPDVGRTRVTYERGDAVAPDWIGVQAAVGEQPHADATLRAVLAEGLLRGRRAERALTVVFKGAAQSEDSLTRPPTARWMREALERMPDLGGGERDGRLIVLLDQSATDQTAVDVLARVVRIVFEDRLDALEPTAMPQATLDAWARAPRPVANDRRPTDEGDRRWLWAAALALLILEQAWRQARGSKATESASASQETEARVA